MRYLSLYLEAIDVRKQNSELLYLHGRLCLYVLSPVFSVEYLGDAQESQPCQIVWLENLQ